MIRRLEIDALGVLKFMASNGLIANPKKTSLVILNNGKIKEKTEDRIKVKIGKDTVTQEESAKLLGIQFNEKQKWNTQIHGKGGVIPSLNMRLFAINRLKNHINRTALTKIVDGLFTSKIRYGLQLFGRVRLSDQDPINGDLKEIQMAQNRMMRSLQGKKLSDQTPIKDLLQATNMLSINQLNAQIKILEIWKATNINDYPLKLNKKEIIPGQTNTRSCTQGRLVVPGTIPIMQKTCITDAIRLWNSSPTEVTSATSLSMAKKVTKTFVKTLPT